MTETQSRMATAVGVIVLGAVGVAYLFWAVPSFTYSGDHAFFLGLANSLAEGEGYWFNGGWHTRFPPAWPSLLAMGRMVGADDGDLSRLAAGMAVLALLAFWRYTALRREPYGVLLVLVLALSAGFVRVATMGPMPDMLYIATSLLLLGWAERAVREDRLSPELLVLGPLLVVAAIALRTVGVAIVGALGLTVVQELVRRRRGAAASPRGYLPALVAAAVAGALFFVSWEFWIEAHRTPRYPGEYMDSYLAQIRMVDPHQPDLGTAGAWDVLARIPQGLMDRIAELATLATNMPWRAFWFSPVLIGAITLASIGWLREVRRPQPLAAWFVLTHLAILMLWPFAEQGRLSLPMLPVGLLLVLEGGRVVRHHLLTRPLAPFARGAAAAAIAILAGAVLARALGGTSWALQEYAAAVVWSGLAVSALLLARRGASPGPRRVGLATSALVAMYALVHVTGAALAMRRVDDRGEASPREWRHGVMVATAEWVRRNTQPDDVLMAASDAALHYATGRTVAPLPVTADPEVLAATLERARPDYLVVNDPLPWEYFKPGECERLRSLLTATSAHLERVAAYPGGRIFRVLYDARNDRSSPSVSPRGCRSRTARSF